MIQLTLADGSIATVQNGVIKVLPPPNAVTGAVATQQHRDQAASLCDYPPPRIGAPWPAQGGIYAGLMRSRDGRPDYHLIVAATEDGFVGDIAWGGCEKDEPNAKSEWDGQANTPGAGALGHRAPGCGMGRGVEDRRLRRLVPDGAARGFAVLCQRV